MKPILNYAITVAAAVLLIGFSQGAMAQTPAGINFFHGTWAEGLAKAKTEKKMVFVDAYAAWCGPCKWMAANTFVDAGVGEYFNKNFINFKMDMEKGDAIALGRTWGIRAYPTLLFFNADGKEVHRSMGAKPAADFIVVGKEAAGKSQGVKASQGGSK